MDTLIKYLNRCEDNKFFVSGLDGRLDIENWYDIHDEDECHKICDELNDLLSGIKLACRHEQKVERSE